MVGWRVMTSLIQHSEGVYSQGVCRHCVRSEYVQSEPIPEGEGELAWEKLYGFSLFSSDFLPIPTENNKLGPLRDHGMVEILKAAFGHKHNCDIILDHGFAKILRSHNCLPGAPMVHRSISIGPEKIIVKKFVKICVFFPCQIFQKSKSGGTQEAPRAPRAPVASEREKYCNPSQL